MVTWSSAFRRGSVVFLWALLWTAIGVTIMVIFALPLVFWFFAFSAFLEDLIRSILQNPTVIPPGSPVLEIVSLIAGVLIGIVVISIGIYSTAYKITLEAVERKTSGQTIPEQTKKPVSE